jgi:hypothetical protein
VKKKKEKKRKKKMSNEESLSWADIVELDEAEKKRKLKKAKKLQKFAKLREQTKRDPGGEVGREVFVGNIEFDDLKNLNVKAKVLYNLIEKRRELLMDIFKSFGQVTFVRPYWNKQYLFVIFQEPAGAERCIATLKEYENRLKLIKQMRKTLKTQSLSPLAAPKPSFYVRWPKYEGLEEITTTVTA